MRPEKKRGFGFFGGRSLIYPLVGQVSISVNDFSVRLQCGVPIGVAVLGVLFAFQRTELGFKQNAELTVLADDESEFVLHLGAQALKQGIIIFQQFQRFVISVVVVDVAPTVSQILGNIPNFPFLWFAEGNEH